MNKSAYKLMIQQKAKDLGFFFCGFSKADFLEVCGNATSHTAANAYPRTVISNTHINEWLVQSDSSLELESVPNSTGAPEFKNIESV